MNFFFFLRAESINDQVNLSDYMVTQNMGFIFEYLIMFFYASLAILKIINKVLEAYFCSPRWQSKFASLGLEALRVSRCLQQDFFPLDCLSNGDEVKIADYFLSPFENNNNENLLSSVLSNIWLNCSLVSLFCLF